MIKCVRIPIIEVQIMIKYVRIPIIEVQIMIKCVRIPIIEVQIFKRYNIVLCKFLNHSNSFDFLSSAMCYQGTKKQLSIPIGSQIWG